MGKRKHSKVLMEAKKKIKVSETEELKPSRMSDEPVKRKVDNM